MFNLLRLFNPFSNACPFCNISQDNNEICFDCFNKLLFLNNGCIKCQEPFEYVLPDINVCAHCASKKHFHIEMRCPLIYNQFIKTLIIRYKNNEEIFLKNIFAKLIYNNSKDVLKNSIIVPIPLFIDKLKQRGFNQSWFLAKELAKLSNSKAIDLMIRIQNTQSQAGKTIDERIKNVENAFDINPEYINSIKNQKICLIDDVITTGATIFAASKVLDKFGAKVYIISLARRIKFIQ